MQFNINDALPVLERTPQVVSDLLKDLPETWLFKNEGGDTWNPYDVVGHLIHGERTDWIARMEICLSDGPNKKFEKFDRTAMFEESKGKSLDELLQEFAELRKQNIQKLRSVTLDEATLDKKAIHPVFGEVNLRQLLSTWVAHDLTHIYQIVRVMAKQYDQEVGPWKEYLGILKDRQS
ncbi:MAG TPA: DinB family protein [Chitinophagaceae bacterium]|nr:DinB family protein [Chitinophagaceae bacterium]